MNLHRSLISLASGNIISRLIVIGSMPILTRIFSPSDFGVFYVVVGFSSVAIPLVSLGYTNAIPVVHRDVRAIAIMGCCIASTVISTAILVTFIIGISYAFDFDAINEIAKNVWFLAGLIISSSFIEVAAAWQTRERRLDITSTALVLKALISEVLKGLLGFSVPGPHSLLTGHLFGAILAAVYSFVSIPIHRIIYYISRPKYFISVFFRYREYALFRMPAQALSAAGVQAPVLILGLSYGSTSAGHVAIAVNMISVPVSIFGQSLSRAIFSELSHAIRTSSEDINLVRKIFRHGMAISFLIGAPIALLAYLFASPVFSFVFGDRWSHAGSYVSILSIYMFFQFMSYPLMSALNFSSAQIAFLRIHAQRAVIAAASLFIPILFRQSIETSLFIYSVSMCLHYVLVLAFVVRTFDSFVSGGRVGKN